MRSDWLFCIFYKSSNYISFRGYELPGRKLATCIRGDVSAFRDHRFVLIMQLSSERKKTLFCYTKKELLWLTCSVREAHRSSCSALPYLCFLRYSLTPRRNTSSPRNKFIIRSRNAPTQSISLLNIEEVLQFKTLIIQNFYKQDRQEGICRNQNKKYFLCAFLYWTMKRYSYLYFPLIC